jgi:hypothetical protein
VNSSNNGQILSNDASDSLIAMTQNADESTTSFFGTRDSTGLTKSISGFTRALPDGSFQRVDIDTSGRPSRFTLSDGSLFTLAWSSNEAAIFNAISSDHKVQVSGALLLAAPTGASEPSLSRAVKLSTHHDAIPFDTPTSKPMATQEVNVTSCNGKNTEDGAVVSVTEVETGGQNRRFPRVVAFTQLKSRPDRIRTVSINKPKRISRAFNPHAISSGRPAHPTLLCQLSIPNFVRL